MSDLLVGEAFSQIMSPADLLPADCEAPAPRSDSTQC
jgi:hypothetical protein